MFFKNVLVSILELWDEKQEKYFPSLENFFSNKKCCFRAHQEESMPL